MKSVFLDVDVCDLKHDIEIINLFCLLFTKSRNPFSEHIYSPKSTGNTQEAVAPSQRD